MPPAPTLAAGANRAAELLQAIDIDLIDPSPYQPRTRFAETGLEELSSSIRASGVIQPLVVRQRGGRYQLIAGERRWRAAQRAALLKIPAVVREVDDQAALEMTLVENLQREDLNPIEQAGAFVRLIEEFSLTQEQVAERTGKDRTTIANALRLLKLEAPIREMIEAGELSAGAGRALLAIENAKTRMALAKKAARGAITVRQIERLGSRRGAPARAAATETAGDPNVRAALEELQRELGTRVYLRAKRGARPGMLMMEYYDDRHLASLYDRLMRK
jgi:ParB family transcriptional regulator, chromosome partitioning protein